MSRRYAENTTTSPEKSIADIRSYAERRGASGFTYVMGVDGGQVRFQIANRWVQFTVHHPGEDEQQEWRRRWRVVMLKVKAAFEIFADGADGETTVEEAFMPYLLLPDGSTVGDVVAQQMDAVYAGEITSADFFRPALEASK